MSVRLGRPAEIRPGAPVWYSSSVHAVPRFFKGVIKI